MHNHISFKEWLQIETAKELAKAYSDALKDIPQDTTHHPEGNVLTHIKLVRKAIPDAINYLIQLKQTPPFNEILKNINIVPDEKQLNLLKLSAWLHDIGKIPTTTITADSGTRHWKEPGEEGKIRSLRHEDKEFYQQEIEKLIPLAPQKIKDLHQQNTDLLDFLIQRHMDVSKGGFPKHFVAEFFDNGILKNEEKIKLLLILIYADKMGRTPRSEKSIQKNDEALITASNKSKENFQKQQKKQQYSTPEEMRADLTLKKMSPEKIEKAIRNKFGQ
jgi:hypothetical protein